MWSKGTLHQRHRQTGHPLETCIARDHHGGGAELLAAGGLQRIGRAQVVISPQERGLLNHRGRELHPLQIRS